MAFPTVAAADSKNGTQTSNSTSWTLTYPTNIAANDLLLAFIGSDGTPGAGTWPSGWVADAQSGGNCQFIPAKKKATGSETGNFTVTMGASEQGCWRVIRIPAAQWEGTLGTTWSSIAATSGAVQSAGTTGGTGSAPNPQSLNPLDWDAEDTLWVAGTAIDAAATCTGFSSGFTQEDHSTAGGHAASSGGSTGAGLAVCYRKENISSQDPGAFTLSASTGYNTRTIGIRPAASGNTGTLAASTAGNYS